jgi:hypothetical protein
MAKEFNLKEVLNKVEDVVKELKDKMEGFFDKFDRD